MNKNFLLLPLLLFSTIANGQVDAAKTVATVNGEEIKGAEYYRRMEYLPGVGKNFSRVFTELPPGLLALDQIITDKIVLLLAREKGVVPSELEVTKEIERRSAADATYAKKWNESGRTADELREVVKLELAQYKLQTFGVTITDQEVTQYYTANPERSTIPKAFKLRVIAVNSKAEQAAVDAELSKGGSFAESAKKHSILASRESGGEYAIVPETALPANMRVPVGSLVKGAATSWLESKEEGGAIFLKFYADDVFPSKRQPLDANMKSAIRREMMLQRGRVKNDVPKMVREMRQKAQIVIANPYFAELYKQLISSAAGASPASSAGSGG